MSSEFRRPVVDMKEGLVRCSAAAQFLGVSEWSIRKMAHAGELPYIQRAGHSSPMLFDPGDLRQWMEQQKIRS
jgi:excisionase family DNA binding protein